MRKLLIIGSGKSVHVLNYLKLIQGYFDDILWISDTRQPETRYRTVVTNFSLKNPLNRFRTVHTIRREIKLFEPSIIHIHQANSFAFYTLAAAKKLPIPKVLTAWGSDILLVPRKNYLLKNMVIYNLRHADACTSDSSYMAEEMNRLAAKKLDITIANFGIDTNGIIVLPKENIIYSNRLHKKLYRIDKIIQGFKKFVDNGHPEWNLIIAATGEETESLKKLTTELRLTDNVHFAGWVDKQQNEEFYARAKIFVSIPESDATSISLLESMAHGCIPVLSNLPANKEWVTDKINGVIVENIETDFFSSALKMDSESLIAQNKKIVSKRGSKEANRNQFISFYNKLLSRK